MLEVADLGGSIAGCPATIRPHRTGHGVRVDERSSTDHHRLDSGIGNPVPVLERLAADGEVVDILRRVAVG